MPTYTAPGVYVEEVSSGNKPLSGVPTAIAAFVGFTAKAPTDDPNDPEGIKPRLVTNWVDYEKLYGGFAPGCLLPLSVYGFFQNGGTTAYIVRIANSAPSGQPSTKALPAADRALGAPVVVSSIEPDAALSVRIEVEDPGEDADGPRPFAIHVEEDGAVVESYRGLGLGGDKDAAKVVNAASTRVKVAVELDKGVDLSTLIDVMKPGVYELAKAEPSTVPVSGRSFAGSEAARTGINGLAIADDVTMVIVPDLATACRQADGSIDLGLWKAVQTTLLTHCELHANRVAILDAPPGMNAQQIRDWRNDVAMYDSAFASMYYPWIKVENPIGNNGDREVLIPPSGHVAGLWARVDESRGVWKAPANEVLQGVLDVEVNTTQAEQGLLNPIGINCIRPFGSRGIRVWGGRTLQLRSRVALPERPAAVQHGRGVDHGRHAVGGVRAQRPQHLELRHPEPDGLPHRPVAPGRPVRSHPRGGVLRPLRRDHQPARGPRPGSPHLRGGHRPGEAGRVRGVPRQPVPA